MFVVSSLLTLQSQVSKKIAKVHEASNSKAKQEDSFLKLVTAFESLSPQLSSLKQDFQDLKQKNVNSRNETNV